MSDTDEFAPIYSKAERLRLLVLQILAGGLIIALSKLWLFPWLRNFSETAACRTVFGVSGTTVLFHGLFVGIPLFVALMLALTLGRRGLKVLREGRTPPSGEKAFRRTRVRRGAQATAAGVMQMLSVVFMLVLATWGGFQAEALLGRLEQQPAKCPAMDKASWEPLLERLAPWVLGTGSTLGLSAEPMSLACPQVMAHAPIKEQHPGWLVYSNDPLRLSGADIAYVVDSHLEATLEPDAVTALNDANLSTASVFRLGKHRGKGPFSLVCHYGVHAQLSRVIPKGVNECTLVRHGRFDDQDGEFGMSCS